MRIAGRCVAFVATAGLEVLVAAPAAAEGPYMDELSRCLVRSTTSENKTLLIQWIFSVIALHPDVARLATVSDSDRNEINRKTAALFENLLTQTCRSETAEALRYEGQAALSGSFNVLGQVAARELFANTKVAGGLAELEKFINADRLKKALTQDK